VGARQSNSSASRIPTAAPLHSHHRMSHLIPTIEREELREALQGPNPPALFEVLPRGYWLKQHLPGARNAPPDTAAAVIAEAVPDPRTPIVVYCWDDT
jgi:rhodanese-related sulfurtransferase